MRHRLRCTKIYSVRKLTNARERNFYAYENFCDYSTWFCSVLICDKCAAHGQSKAFPNAMHSPIVWFARRNAITRAHSRAHARARTSRLHVHGDLCAWKAPATRSPTPAIANDLRRRSTTRDSRSFTAASMRKASPIAIECKLLSWDLNSESSDLGRWWEA